MFIREHPLSTYAPRGRGVSKSGKYAYDSTDRLREKRTRGGEGVKKAGKSAYVLNGCSLMGSPHHICRHSRHLLRQSFIHNLNPEQDRSWVISDFVAKHGTRSVEKEGGGAEEKSTSAVVAQVHARPASAASVVADSATAPPLLVDLPRHRRNRPG